MAGECWTGMSWQSNAIRSFVGNPYKPPSSSSSRTFEFEVIQETKARSRINTVVQSIQSYVWRERERETI